MTHPGHHHSDRALVTDPVDDASHVHPLILTQGSIPYECNGCKELGFGVRYECTRCSFHLHRECKDRRSPHRHSLLKSCELEFYETSPVPGDQAICDACSTKVKGFCYFGQESTLFRGPKMRLLHPPCANLNPVQSFSVNGRTKALLLKRKAWTKCRQCQIGGEGWSYVCDDICVHVACVKKATYEAWQRKYYGNTIDDQLTFPSPETGSSSGHSGIRSAIAMAILTAIFGAPINATIGSLVQALLENLFQ